MSGELATVTNALTVQQVVEHREIVKTAMKNAMTEGQHYGKVPGCGDKPSLMQPGAQLLSHLFRFRPEYEVFEKELPDNHREYRVTCRLIHMASGQEVSQGVGICSSMESKYRFRNAAKEVQWLNESVPGVYWNFKNKPPEERIRWLKTVFQNEDVESIGVKKNDQGQWMFVRFMGGEGKVENTNIADVFNTVLKIGKKRAFVDATITATATNDLFTQDLEDIGENLRSAQHVEPREGFDPGNAAVSNGPGEGKTEVVPKEAATPPAKDVTPKTPPKEEKKPEKAAGAPATGKRWQDVTVHFGTDGGKIKGRALGTLSKSTLEWLEEQMNRKSVRTKDDNILLAALGLWRSEVAKTPSTPLRDMLKAKCEAMKIPLASMVAIDRRLGANGVDKFEDIKEDEAKYILENWSQFEQEAKDAADTLPMT